MDKATSPHSPAPVASRNVQSWSDAELRKARAWRSKRPPMTFAEIGRRLGGRSGQAVRLKLYEAQSAEKRRASRTKAFRRAAPEDGQTIHHDDLLVAACRVSGGFTSFSSKVVGGQTVVCGPLIGAGGITRPPYWRDGRSALEPSPAITGHLEALSAYWRECDERVANFQPQHPSERIEQ